MRLFAKMFLCVVLLSSAGCTRYISPGNRAVDGSQNQTVTFTTAEKAPAAFDAWSFFWRYPKMDKTVEFSLVVNDPAGKVYWSAPASQWFRSKMRSGRKIKSDFSAELNGCDPGVFFNQNISYRIQVNNGRVWLNESLLDQYGFAFFKKDKDGRINRQKPFKTIKAVVQ